MFLHRAIAHTARRRGRPLHVDAKRSALWTSGREIFFQFGPVPTRLAPSQLQSEAARGCAPPHRRGRPMAAQDGGSVTRWIGDLKAGGDSSAQRLWERYFQRLVNLAHARLRSARRPGAIEDEEDAALSAFDSFCRGATAGRFPQKLSK